MAGICPVLFVATLSTLSTSFDCTHWRLGSGHVHHYKREAWPGKATTLTWITNQTHQELQELLTSKDYHRFSSISTVITVISAILSWYLDYLHMSLWSWTLIIAVPWAALQWHWAAKYSWVQPLRSCIASCITSSMSCIVVLGGPLRSLSSMSIQIVSQPFIADFLKLIQNH